MKVASDKHRFDVVWKGAWYRLANLTEHLKHKVPDGQWLLLDNLWRHYVVPRSEVHLPPNPIP